LSPPHEILHGCQQAANTIVSVKAEYSTDLLFETHAKESNLPLRISGKSGWTSQNGDYQHEQTARLQ
jgi:hypothetical protein